MILQQIKQVLIEMSTCERASALSFLAAMVAEAEQYPSGTNPRVLRFMLFAMQLSYDEQVNLVVVIGCSLKNPEVLTSNTSERRDKYAMN